MLYGFTAKSERELFRMLIAVSGVGGNTARMVLSTYTPAELRQIISGGNVPMLKKGKGVGFQDCGEDNSGASRQDGGARCGR